MKKESSKDIKDLEYDFEGVRILKVSGISNLGKPKNIYTNSYAESESENVLMPDVICREPTDIEVEFFVTGDNYMAIHDAFIDYCSSGVIHYWDTYRRRKVRLINLESYEVVEESFKSSIKYIKSVIKFKNIDGKSVSIDL